MEDQATVVHRDTYYLDDRLSLAEGTRVFAQGGAGRETVEEGFYSLAIRKSGFRQCIYRFPDRERTLARSMLETMNRSAAVDGWSVA